MIPDTTKNQAIAKLKRNMPAEMIASELDLPLMLVKEWESKLNPNDLVALEANIQAVEEVTQRVLNGEIVPGNEETLKNELEKAAIQIAQASTKPIFIGDMLHAKAVQLCADAVSKLYQTLILKGAPAGQGSSGGQSNSRFHDLMKD